MSRSPAPRSTSPSGNKHERQLGVGAAEQGEQATGVGVAFDLQPAVRHVVPGEEHPRVVAAFGPPVADDPHAVEAVGVLAVPLVEQVVEHRVQPLLGRCPWLHQVVVEPDLVDRPDRHVGVGVCGEQDELGVRGVRLRAPEQLDAGHRRHPMVGHDQGDRLVAQGQFLQRAQRLAHQTRCGQRGTGSPYWARRSRVIACDTDASSSTVRMMASAMSLPSGATFVPGG